MRVERRFRLPLLLAAVLLLGSVLPADAAGRPTAPSRVEAAGPSAIERLEQSLVERLRMAWIVARQLGARLPEPPLGTDGLSDGPDPIGAVGDTTGENDRSGDPNPPGGPTPGTSAGDLNWGQPPRSDR